MCGMIPKKGRAFAALSLNQLTGYVNGLCVVQRSRAVLSLFLQCAYLGIILERESTCFSDHNLCSVFCVGLSESGAQNVLLNLRRFLCVSTCVFFTKSCQFVSSLTTWESYRVNSRFAGPSIGCRLEIGPATSSLSTDMITMYVIMLPYSECVRRTHTIRLWLIVRESFSNFQIFAPSLPACYLSFHCTRLTPYETSFHLQNLDDFHPPPKTCPFDIDFESSLSRMHFETISFLFQATFFFVSRESARTK